MDDTNSQSILVYDEKHDEALPEVTQKPGVYTSFGIATDAEGGTLPTRSFQGSIGKAGVNINLGAQLQTALTQVNNQGGGAVHLRAGTYFVKASLIGYSETEIAGDAAGASIVDFGSTNIGLFFTGTSVYTTGTITAISANGITVTGTGTSWLANVTTSHHLFIGTRWYKIAAVVADTTIILAEAYSDNLTLPQNYRAAIPVKDLIFRDITFQNSTGTLITFSDCRDITFVNCRFLTSAVGYAMTNCSEVDVSTMIVAGNSSDGVQMTNVGLCDFTSLETVGNGGNGLTLNNLKTAFFIGCASDANTGDGINATSVVDCAFKYECRSNGGQGIEFVSGCQNNFINDSLIRNNGSDGIKFTASALNNTIGGAINIVSNGGYGINIADGTSTNNTIIAPFYLSNASGTYRNLGTTTLLVIPTAAPKHFQVDTAGTLTTGLDVYYKLEDATEYYVGGGTYDLTNNNVVTFTAAKVSNGATFNGTTNYLSRSSPVSTATSAFSVAFWVYVTSTSQKRGWVRNGNDQPNPNSTGWGIGQQLDSGGGANKVAFVNSQIAWLVSSTSLTIGFHHIVGTKNSSNVWKLWIDGVQDANTMTGAMGAAPSTKFEIGRQAENGGTLYYDDDRIDELGVWDKELSSQEVADLYNGGSGQTMTT